MRQVVAALLVSVFVLAGCSASPDEKIERSTLEVMYDTAQRHLDVGRYADAAQVLEQINTAYPFGAYTQLVQLDLMFAFYKIADQDKALATIDRFLQLNPNHADLDYVRYMRALVYQQAEFSFFQNLFNIDRSDRSTYYAERAFEEFGELIRRYPNSQYAPDARMRMLALSSRLARHDIAVAEYYLRREAFVAAANRAKGIIESHPHAPEQKRALEIMVESYTKLGMDTLASDAQSLLQAYTN